MALEQARLRELHPAVARRVVRAAARRLGARLNFEQTEQLLAMGESRPGKFELPGGIMVERSLREIRLTRSSAPSTPGPEYVFPVPGDIRAPEYGLSLHGVRVQDGLSSASAVLRPWKAGDRVTLRAQPASQESCRGSRPAPRAWRSTKKLAGGRVGRKDCLDARGGRGGARICLYGPIPGLKRAKQGNRNSEYPSRITSDTLSHAFGDVSSFRGVE